MSSQISAVFSCLVMWLMVFLVVVFGKVQRAQNHFWQGPESPKSFLDHKLHTCRKSTVVGTSWCPTHLCEGKASLREHEKF